MNSESDTEKDFFKPFVGKTVWLLKEENEQPYSMIGRLLNVNDKFLTIEMNKDIRMIALEKVKEIKIRKEGIQ